MTRGTRATLRALLGVAVALDFIALVAIMVPAIVVAEVALILGLITTAGALSMLDGLSVDDDPTPSSP